MQRLELGSYVEPTAARHALARNRVWLLRELATNPDTEFSLVECFKLRCIFFHIPKTAGLSLSAALFGNRGLGHIDVRTARILFGERRFSSFFKFCFVRNPWDRLVSAYHYLHAGHPNSPSPTPSPDARASPSSSSSCCPRRRWRASSTSVRSTRSS